ncbi:MAG: hypothetical protein II565_14340 [Fibrobacter sp.]|nr:hypothetical protein [Fibrobacter sp.]
MRLVAFFSIVVVLLLCASCSYVPHTLLNGPKNPQPLPDSIPVLVINAASIPVVPQENTYLGTIKTGAKTGCTSDGTINYLRRLARSIGANIVYVKESDVKMVFVYTQFGSVTSHCLTLIADFLYAEAPVISKWEEEVKKLEESRKAKE